MKVPCRLFALPCGPHGENQSRWLRALKLSFRLQCRDATCLSESWRWDLNPQPAVYKTAALPVELRQRRSCLREKVTPERFELSRLLATGF